jgi:hypothetical protein
MTVILIGEFGAAFRDIGQEESKRLEENPLDPKHQEW